MVKDMKSSSGITTKFIQLTDNILLFWNNLQQGKLKMQVCTESQ